MDNMDLPNCLNKSRSDLDKLDKNELIDIIVTSNSFILKHLLSENTLLKEKLAVLTTTTTAQSQAIDDLTLRLSSIEAEVWRKDIDTRQKSVEFSGINKNR